VAKWYNRLLSDNSEQKDAAALEARLASEAQEKRDLVQRLDAVMGEFKDSMQYEAKFFDSDPTNFAGSGFVDVGGADQLISTAALAKLYTSETWVYVAITAIAETIAALPIKLEKRKVNRQEDVEQEVWVDASADKLAERFKFPNPHCSKTEFITLLLIDLLTTGEFYVLLDTDEDITTPSTDAERNSAFGRLQAAMAKTSPIKAMYRIPPALIKPEPAENSYGLEGYMVQSDRGMFFYSEAEIVCGKLPNPLDPFRGLSPLIAALKPVLIDRFSTEHMIRFYKSGARLGGVIETDKALNKEQLSRFQRSFENNYTGRANHHRTLILPPGMKYEPIEQNPAQTSLLEFCKYNREAILAAYKVPPIKAGVTDGQNYANSRAQLRTFLKDSILPKLAFVEDAFNRKKTLLPVGSTRIRFDLSDVEELQDDGQALANVAKGMLDGGATVNEVRKKVWKLGPIEEGEQSPVIAKITRDTMNTQIGLGLAAGEDPAALAETAESAETNKPAEGAPTDKPAEPPKPGEQAVDAHRASVAQQAVTDPTLSLNGAQVQAMLSIIQQVNGGLLPRASGIELIVAAFSVPRDAAERIMGDVGAGFQPNPNVPADSIINLDAGKPDAVKDAPIGPGTDLHPTNVSFKVRVQQLTAEYVQGGTPLATAVERAIAQALAEGLSPDDEDPNDPQGGGTVPPNDQSGPGDGPAPGGKMSSESMAAVIPAGMAGGEPKKPCECEGTEGCDCEDKEKGATEISLEQFIKTSLEAMGDQPVTPDLLRMLLAQFEARAGAKSPDVAQKTPYANGATKEAITAQWKGFIDQTQPLILKRAIAVQKFFDRMKSLASNRLGANIKAYGIHKARDNDDIDEIVEASAYEPAIAEYIKAVDAALLEAAKFGYNDTLTEFKFGGRNEKEIADLLRKYLGDKVKGITDTTLEQMRSVLADSFEAGDSVGDTAKKLSEKFEEMKQGRAVTIARTETLTAVSIGREMKREDFRAEFPEKKFRKMWVAAQDNRVRDSHDALDGKSVEDGEAFENGLLYPRDPSGPAEEVINCRCTEITYFAEQEEQIQDQLPAEGGSDEEKSAWVCAAGIVAHKGGPGSGCQGPNCGRPRGATTGTDSDGDGNPGSAGSSGSSDLSPALRALIGRAAAGEGAAVDLDRDQITEVLDKGTYALVSAGKNIKDAEDNALSDEQIKQRYDQLEADLKAAGYKYTRVAGHYGAKEDTFLVQVHEANRSEMIKLGVKYKQDSIIYTSRKKNEMIYTTGEHQGKKQVGEGYTWQDDADDFYTVVTHPGGKVSKFQLNFDFDTPPKGYCAAGIHTKGGPGSGCRGPNCGRPRGGGGNSTPEGRPGGEYARPSIKPLAGKDIAPSERTNNFQRGPYSGTTAGDAFLGVKGAQMTVAHTYAFRKVAMKELSPFTKALDKWAEGLAAEGITVRDQFQREKKEGSLLDKMRGKWTDKTLDQVTDGLGGRFIFDSQEELDRAVIKSGRLAGLTILEHRDFLKDGKGDGYNATHLLVRTPNGFVAEVQFKTHNQDVWSSWGHDGIYKAPAPKDNRPDFSKDAAAKDYAKAVGLYLAEIDLGRVPSTPRPEAPKHVAEAGMEFPWDKANANPYGKKS
jgi:phage portal protein BeeE/ppGpp synthetase/RelA/SpoT-type nucleotidyltranferase